MHYVYLLQSGNHSDQIYTGSTSDLRKHLAEHNDGKLKHTSKFKPWELTAYIALPEKHIAKQFETYLKSGSGRAFAKSHLLAKNERDS